MCVEESGEEIDDIFLLKKSEEKNGLKRARPSAVLRTSSVVILRGHARIDKRTCTGEMGGNRQSALLARSASKKTYSSKSSSSTKSSLPPHGRAIFSNTYNRFSNRNADVEAQPPSKRRLTMKKKAKGR
ncbi:hypothetical protein LINPERHAP2_LOCUS9351 [Linum perenne]